MSTLRGAPPSTPSPVSSGTSPRIAAAAWAAARARDAAATRAPIPSGRARTLPPPPPLRDGSAAVAAGDARAQTRAALWRLVAVAHALAPAPLPPQGAAHPAALDWVAARLENFGDRIEKARGATAAAAAAARVIEPAPWPAFPAAAAKTADGRTNSVERYAARPPRHPSSGVVRERRGEKKEVHVSGAVMSRARQLEALLGGAVPPAPAYSPARSRPPPPPPPPPPFRAARPVQHAAAAASSAVREGKEEKEQFEADKMEIDHMDVDHKAEERSASLDLPLSPKRAILELPLSPKPLPVAEQLPDRKLALEQPSEEQQLSDPEPKSAVQTPATSEEPGLLEQTTQEARQVLQTSSSVPDRLPDRTHVLDQPGEGEELGDPGLELDPEPEPKSSAQTPVISEQPRLFEETQDGGQLSEWDKPFQLGSPPIVSKSQVPHQNALSTHLPLAEHRLQPGLPERIPVASDRDIVQIPFPPHLPLSPERPISPPVNHSEQQHQAGSCERNFTPASETLISPPVPLPLQRHAEPLMPPKSFAMEPFSGDADGIGKRALSDGSCDPEDMQLPKLPSGLDLPMSRDTSSASRAGEPGGHFIRLPSETSVLSRGSGGRARLRADYDRIYNRPTDAPFPQNESQIKIAGGDLFVDGPVEERWEMGKKIGEGGFSTVYRATRKAHERYVGDTATPKACAIKVISKRPEPFNRRMVEREVFSFRLLEMVGGQENIVRLYEVSEDEEHVYLVMELLEGGELFSRISERGNYTERDAANLVVSMLASLRFCHRLNLTHRDVKPENFVFLKKANNEAELKLTDFGIAHYSEDPKATCKTMCGTPLYIAPEVLFRQPYGAEADLWSLGVIVYIMLAGYPPFHDHDIVQLVKKIKYKPVAFDGPEWVLISEQGKQFLTNLLDKDKSNRMSAQQALEHEWLKNNCHAATKNVLEVAQVNIKSFVTRKRWKVAIQGVKAMNKFTRIVDSHNPLFSDHSGPPTSDSMAFGANGPQTPNAAALEEYQASAARNFTVATENTLDEADPGSLWQRLKRDRFLQPRRPQSRNTSRYSTSRDGMGRMEGGFGPSAELTPQSSCDSRTLRARDGRGESASLVALATSPEPLSSSMSSVDPVSGGMSTSAGALVRSESRRSRMLKLWKGRRLRVTSHVSEPNTGNGEGEERLGWRMHQSHHLQGRDGTRFKLFGRS